MTEADKWQQLKADPIRYALYLERKRQERKRRVGYEAKRKANWRLNNPNLNEKHRLAHHAVEYAILTGKLQRSDLCEICGADSFIQAHHEDYSKPLQVNWLCQSCHSERHYPRTKPSYCGVVGPERQCQKATNL